MVGLTVKTSLAATAEPFPLIIEGRAVMGKTEIVHQAVPAEDRMQAFLWRHLVPARDLEALVFDPAYQPPPKRVPPTAPDPTLEPQNVKPAETTTAQPKPKFTQQQVVSRLRDLKRLYGAGYLTDQFYLEKLAECQVPQ
jgi:hypothetical protein